MTILLAEPDPAFEPFRLLDRDGSLRDEAAVEPDIAMVEEMHEAMLRARRVDERLLSLQRRGDLGTFAPVKGQEAAQIGSISCIGDEDWFVPSFREMAAALWREQSLVDLLVATAGWNEGLATRQDARNLPPAIPVASQLPHAVGIAHAGRLRGEESVVLTYFGDGATSEGDFHEALNFASVLNAPVVFFCQNNGWAISTPRARQTGSRTLCQKAHAYGISAAQVDGNDLLAVRAVTREAVRRAREEGRPSMIEALTYRMEVHTTADDPTRYRDDDEVEKWRARDPINRVQALLKARDQIDDEMIAALESQIEDEIDKAWDDAKEQIRELEDGVPDAIFDHVFREPTAELDRQRDLFAKLERRDDG